MSLSKESVLFVILANLVFTIVVVAAAVMILKDDKAEGDDSKLRALENKVAEMERSRDAADQGLDPAELNLKSELQAISERQTELMGRLDELEKAPRAVAGGGTVDSGAGGGDAAAKPNPTDALMKIAGKMMADRMKRERDRYVDAIMNPTPETKAQQERMFRGLARRTGRSLQLDEQQQTQLEEILIDVDNLRRDQFRDLINSKPSPNDVTPDEVDRILKDSWEEEDRRIESSLPREKSDQYKKEAEPMRGMMSGMAKSLFNEEDQNK